MKQRFFLRNFLLVTLPVILVVVLLGWMAVYVINSSTRKSIAELNRQTVSRIRESTELMFSEADAQSLNYSITPHVMLRLEALLKNGYTEKEYMDVSYMIKSFVDSNVNSKSYMHSLYIYLNNVNDNFFASFVGLANKSNFRDTEWLEHARTQPLELKQWLELRRIGSYALTVYLTDVLSVFKRIYTSDKRNPVGVLVLNIRLDYLNSFYSEYLSYPGQTILLINDSGEILSGTGLSKDFSAHNFIGIEDLENDFFVAREDNTAYGVTYLSLVPHTASYQQSSDIFRLVIIAIIAALFLGGGIAFIVTRRNTRDINAILQLVDAAEAGKPLPDIKPSSDVYGYITQSIVKGSLEKSALNMQLVEKKYRLEAMYFSFLQSQLNPHFLFNTLKNIFWKTVKLTGEQNGASQMIDLLTGVLHYALVNSDRFVTLQEEIDNTEKYLKIQQMRFDNSFHVFWDIDIDTEAVKCIKFLLQPLVENSITHGLQNMHSGEIQIEIAEMKGMACFSVIDNGTGFSETRLAEIQARMLQEDSPVMSIGLFNLNKRLVLTYGDSSALKIISRPNHKTCISFSIPFENKGSSEEITNERIF